MHGRAASASPVDARSATELAEKSLEAVLPTPEKFPYTIRLVSEILESTDRKHNVGLRRMPALMDAACPSSAGRRDLHRHVEVGKDRKLVVDILGEKTISAKWTSRCPALSAA